LAAGRALRLGENGSGRDYSLLISMELCKKKVMASKRGKVECLAGKVLLICVSRAPAEGDDVARASLASRLRATTRGVRSCACINIWNVNADQSP
jgi:hypothetical protein